jgi:hypothetical protein
MPWCAKLAHDEDIQGGRQRTSDFVGHRNAATRQGQDDEIASPGIHAKVFGEHNPSVTTIGKPCQPVRLWNSHNQRFVQSQCLACRTPSSRECASASTTQCGQIRAAAKNHPSATSLDEVVSNVSSDTKLARPML